MSEGIENKLEGADATKAEEEVQHNAAVEYLLKPFETEVIKVKSLVGNGAYDILAPEYFGFNKK